jgi:hypothetical protein
MILASPNLGFFSCNFRAGHRPELLRELQRLHVTHTVRKLHVGDFVWVAQETRPRDPGKGPWVGGIRGQAWWVRRHKPTGAILSSW